MLTTFLQKSLVILLITLVFQTQLAQASDLICFEEEVAKQIYVEVELSGVNEQKINICLETVTTLKDINNLDKVLISNLGQDKVDLYNLSEDYKKRFINTNNKILELEKDKPSRITWFVAGTASGLCLSLLLMVFAK